MYSKEKIHLRSTHNPENMHLSSPFPPYKALPFSLNTEIGSLSGTDVAAERGTKNKNCTRICRYVDM